MQERTILLRFLAVPLRHKFAAAGIAVAIVSGFFVWSRQGGTEPSTAALLSFDADAPPQSAPAVGIAATGMAATGKAPSKEPAVAFAQRILSDEVVRGIVTQTRVSIFVKDNAAVEFRSRLEMTQPSSKVLQVEYHDRDKDISRAATNAVANRLAAWTPAPVITPAPAAAVAVPAPPPPQAVLPPHAGLPPQAAPAMPIVAAQPHPHTPRLRLRSDLLIKLEAQLAATDRRLAALDAEQRQVSAPRKADADAPPSNAEKEQRRLLESQLSAAQKRLDDLRLRYTDEYPDVETAKEHVAEIQQQLASLPPVRGAPVPSAGPLRQDGVNEASQLRVERDRLTRAIAVEKKREATLRDQAAAAPPAAVAVPVTVPAVSAPAAKQGAVSATRDAVASQPAQTPPAQMGKSPFTLVLPAGEVRPNPAKSGLLWLGLLAGIFCGLFYLEVMIWRYRPIESVAALKQVLPAQVAFLGPIPKFDA